MLMGQSTLRISNDKQCRPSTECGVGPEQNAHFLEHFSLRHGHPDGLSHKEGETTQGKGRGEPYCLKRIPRELKKPREKI